MEIEIEIDRNYIVRHTDDTSTSETASYFQNNISDFRLIKTQIK